MFPFQDHRDKTILLYDGVCILCNGFVQFLISRDRRKAIRFAPIQSAKVRRWLDEETDASELKEDTVILWRDENIYTKSNAALEAIKLLPFPWPILGIFKRIPVGIRDAVYDWVARNRYGWFGRKDHCPLPDPEVWDRFIDWPSRQE